MMCEHKSSFGWCGIRDEGVCRFLSFALCGHGGLAYTLTFAALVLGLICYFLTVGH